ncbi:MAG: hypothetical protein H8D80_01360 [Proteobacteria bacterium]|nr:hypothetical protein [Pseudomonadota bacterium]
MKDRYTKTFSISANTHNIPAHDAIMIVVTHPNSEGSVEVHTYDKATKLGSNGRPYGTDGVTGESIILYAQKGDSPSILPIQVKSISGITTGTVHGLI